MINYFLLLDKNQTTDQKVVSSNPAGRAIKKASKRRLFLWCGADLLPSELVTTPRCEAYKSNDVRLLSREGIPNRLLHNEPPSASKRRLFLWPKHLHSGLKCRLRLISQNLWDKYAIKICFFVNCDIDLL